MIRISALNDTVSDGESKGPTQGRSTTKEAKEAEAFALYNKALGLQRQGEVTRAETMFKELLHHPFMQETVRLVNEEGADTVHPGLQVLYSTHKNMATIALQRNDTTAAIESLLEAVVVDATEVTVWYKIGTLALKLCKYSLARFSFEQGLQCNPRHWPCLDNVITVLYVLNDFWHCLSYIALALERDSGYTKGLAICKQIYKEHAALKKDTEEFFRLCDPATFLTEVDQAEAAEFINEALEMRQKRRELAKVVKPPPVKLPTLANYTWRSLGRSLVALYDYITQSDPPKSLALRIDVSAYGQSAHEAPMETEPVHGEQDVKQESAEPDPKLTPVEQSTCTNVSGENDAICESAGEGVNASPKQPHTPMELDGGAADNKPTADVNVSQVPAVFADGNAVIPVPKDPDGSPAPPSSSAITTPQQPTGETTETMIKSDTEMNVVTESEAPLASVPAEVALHDHPVPMESGDVGAGMRKGAKRKRLPMDHGTKRRSARVRNTNKKKEDETINFHDLLQKFLPSSLIQVSEPDEEDGDVQSAEEVDRQTDGQTDTQSQDEASPVTGCMPLSATEETDVKDLLLKEQENSGLVSMMKHYLHFLSERDNKKWPDTLKETYMEVYSRVRRHLKFPECPDSDGPDPGLKANTKMCLVYMELKLDQWLLHKTKSVPSPGPPTGSPRKTSPVLSPVLGPGFPGQQFKDDVWFLCAMIGFSQILEDFWAEHAIRVYWLKARFSVLSNTMEDAMGWLNTTRAYLKYATENENITEVVLYQCLGDNHISEDKVNQQMASLERCQSLEEIQKFYDDKQYQKVVDCLLQTFKQPQTKHQRREGDNIPERHSQLLLLQDSLFKLSNYQKCIFWGEEILNEALQHYRHAFGSVREEWGATLTQVFAGINKCVSKESGIIGSLPNTSLVRLTHNLMRVIEILMDTPECITVVPIDTVLPWILLYKLIKHEEIKLHSLSVGDGKDDEALEGAITSSFMLLNVAHEYLGRRSWCTNSDGLLLKFIMDVLREEMSKGSHKTSAVFREEINQAFEQCSFCLYGHPNKKSRVKHLQDHGSTQLTLTWDKAIDLFEYFKPKTVPEFDSYKTSTVSGELEGLLRRISTLVPDKYRAANTVELVQSYIEGNSSTPPTAHAEKCAKVPVVRELYYLLADYYFKNKEQMKAMKFYLLDLCYNPDRLDSWAGMALARMSRLEQKLNLHELKMDMPVLKQSISSLRCFRRAVDTDSTNSKLWIEYGCLAYELHSHASRQLKTKHWFPLNEDMLDLARTSRQDMLQIAQNCYQQANQCESDGNEEEWLHHYMMGKVAEKLGKPSEVYLNHYKQAASHTHEDKAVYPRKITYVVSPPHLAVESLEVFYRLHASSLKLLLNHSTKVNYKLIQQYLDEAAESPFAQSKEKRRESRESMSSGSDAELMSGQPGTPTRKKHNYHINPPDHNYSRQKSRETGDKAGLVPQTGTASTGQIQDKIHSKAVTTSKDSGSVITSACSDAVSTAGSGPSECTSENYPDKNVSEIITVNTEYSTVPGKSDSKADSLGLDSNITASVKVDSGGGQVIPGNAVDEKAKQVSDSNSYTGKPSVSSFRMADILGNKVVQADVLTQHKEPPVSQSLSIMDSASDGVPGSSAVLQSANSAMPKSGEAGHSEKPNDDGAVSRSADAEHSQVHIGKSASLNSEESWLSKKPGDISAIAKAEAAGGNPMTVSEPMETDDVFSILESSALSVVTPNTSLNSSQTHTSTTHEPTVKDSVKPTEAAPMEKQKQLASAETNLPVTEKLPSEPPTACAEIGEKPEGNKPLQSTIINTEKKTGEMGCDSSDDSPPGFDHPKHKQLIDQCISALCLCLSRFPQHYKSLYRLAHLYFKSPLHKNLQFARDLMLGNPNWQQLEHMPAPGLFSDRKTTDFFKGVWRIPIDEIDRSGSFPSHLNRSIQLILDVLREQKDASTLFLIHHQLTRVPDLGKKYLRDAERVWFAKQAFIYSLDAMEAQIREIKEGGDPVGQLGFILEVYRLWNYGVNKMATQVDRVNDLFALAFRIICKDKVDKSKPILEQALLFCQEQITLARAQAPSFGSPRSQVQRAGFLSPSADRASDLSHPLYQGQVIIKLPNDISKTTSTLPSQASTVAMSSQNSAVSKSNFSVPSSRQGPSTQPGVASKPTVPDQSPVSVVSTKSAGPNEAGVPVKPTSSSVPPHSVMYSQPGVFSKPEVVQHKDSLDAGALDLSLTSTSSGKAVSSVTSPMSIQGIAPVRTISSPAASKSSDSLLTRMVRQPGEILTDVQRVIQQSVSGHTNQTQVLAYQGGQVHTPSLTSSVPAMSTADGHSKTLQPDLKPSQSTNPPPTSPPLSPIVITDSESSLSSLLDYTIELNDSDFEEPIILSPEEFM